MIDAREIIAEAGAQDTLLTRNMVRVAYYVTFVKLYPRVLIKHMLGK